MVLSVMKKLFLLFGIITLLIGCNNTVENEKKYTGKDLTIGIIGMAPNIKESNVTFEKIGFDDLTTNLEKLTSHLDAIIITKEFLAEADEDQYVSVYLNSSIPIFFMQSTKAHVPFTNEGVDYNNFPEVDSSIYAAGFLGTETDEGYTEQTWRYQLKDNKQNERNIQLVYTQIFNTIESVIPK